MTYGQRWTCPNGQWTERKGPLGPEVAFTAILQRRGKASGDNAEADIGSGEHSLIIAHQWAGKLDGNTSATHFEGTKHLISSRKPGEQGWTTQQRGHTSARLRAIMVLEEILTDLRNRSDGDFEDPIDEQALAGLLEDDDQTAEAAELAEPPVKASARSAVGRGRRSTSRPNRVRRAARTRRAVAATPTQRLRRR